MIALVAIIKKVTVISTLFCLPRNLLVWCRLLVVLELLDARVTPTKAEVYHSLIGLRNVTNFLLSYVSELRVFVSIKEILLCIL